MKNTYKFFAVLLLAVTADVTLSATCTPESGCKATMEDGTKADFCCIFQERTYHSVSKVKLTTCYITGGC